MRNPDTHVRLPTKLLNHVRKEAHQLHETIPQFIRRLLAQRYASATPHKQTLKYGFAGPAKRNIKSYIDLFSEAQRAKKHVKRKKN